MRLKPPLDKIKITQYFGERPEVYKPNRGHMGVDFRTKYDDSKNGERPVYAAAPGRVEIGNQGNYGYGKFVKITHLDGSETIYGHLSSQNVKTGDWVIIQQRIGISGSTGFSDAPHLHFGYRPYRFNKNNGFGGYVDPLLYMDSTISPPYFEQIKRTNSIFFYDAKQDKMVAFGDGDTFKMLFGGYENVLIHQVDKLSKPVAEQPLRIM